MGMVKLGLLHVPPLATCAFVDALVDAAISAGIKNMCFRMPLSQPALPALTRLLQSPGFEELHIWNRSL
jgi:hypothetical protein